MLVVVVGGDGHEPGHVELPVRVVRAGPRPAVGTQRIEDREGAVSDGRVGREDLREVGPGSAQPLTRLHPPPARVLLLVELVEPAVLDLFLDGDEMPDDLDRRPLAGRGRFRGRGAGRRRET